MANTKSAEKRIRQNEERRQRNRGQRSHMRTAVRRLRAAVEAGEAEQARTLLPDTLALIDRTAQKGIIHDNAAARYKSRLSHAVRGLEA
ncbi:MAG TPA: 30S ribosomal protein S20 [Thermoanaerobaculia bacterium]|nr:30S ribosomal protein S20 [Thermoanaerobaculia bacterium]